MEILAFLFYCLYAGFALGFAFNWQWQKVERKPKCRIYKA